MFFIISVCVCGGGGGVCVYICRVLLLLLLGVRVCGGGGGRIVFRGANAGIAIDDIKNDEIGLLRERLPSLLDDINNQRHLSGYQRDSYTPVKSTVKRRLRHKLRKIE